MTIHLVRPRSTDARRHSGLGVLLLALLVTEAACTTTSGAPRGYGYDNSVSAACRQNPAQCATLSGKEAAYEPLVQVGTAVGTIAAVLRVLDDVERGSIDRALERCADRARSEVLLRYPSTFKGTAPDAAECNEETVDARGRSVTWAMRLGTEMHEVASQCAQEELSRLRPSGFSLESRYRYDSRTRGWKQVSPQEERALVESGNAGELRGTLKPDVVIHSGNPLDVLEIYDFKFPCVNPDEVPRWEEYPEGHAYEGFTQDRMYQKLLSPTITTPEQHVVRITPRWGVIR